MNTMTKITVGDEEYLFVKQYQDNNELRSGLNQLTQETFGFSFEGWYQQGLWTDRYRPYSLVHNNQIVANVSVSLIDFIVEGVRKHTVQIGAVMTGSEYRYKGLSRILFDIVMEEYDGKVDLMYLYANPSVRQFYPRFGFTVAEEFFCSKQYTRDTRYSFSKLDGTAVVDRELLFDLISGTMPVSKYAMVNNPYLTMFYLTGPMADCCYYCEELKLVAIVEYEDESMLVDDIFCAGDIDLDQVIASLLDQDQRNVLLGFIPHNMETFHIDLLQDPDTTFFVKGNNFIKNGRLPILSHA